MHIWKHITTSRMVYLLLVTLIGYPAYNQSPDIEHNQVQIKPLSNEVERVFNQLSLPGLAVVVMKDQQVIHNQALGYANLTTKEELTTDHLFWTASVTKAFTAAAFLKAEADDQLALETPIIAFGADRYFLPARTNRHVTLRHLITQTSEGHIPGMHFVYSFRYNWLVAPFGGWDKFEAGLQSHLLDELGIYGLVAGYHSIKNSNRLIVMPHRFNKEMDAFQPSPDDRWEKTIPATNLLASPKGLAQAGQALNAGIGLPIRSAALLNGELANDPIADKTYGYGSFITQLFGKKIIWQYGFGGAESALFVRVPSEHLSIAILSNASELSGVTRLGSGDLLKHPLADALFRYVILEGESLLPSPRWDESIEDIAYQLKKQPKHPLDGHALLTQALINYLKPNPDQKKSKDLLDLGAKEFPDILSMESEPMLWLMTQHADESYMPFVQKQLDLAFARNPNHPWFIGLAAEFYEAIGDEDLAHEFWERNCQNIAYREHSQISDAYLSLALSYESTSPDKAIDLAWQSLDMASWSFSWSRNQEARDLISRLLKN